ncbi:hypothetical protein, partial [Streptomyces sp. ms184]|uniref:hypothetical protein n=1 Tax=Streptomyces sp. ms184 TaxID=1827974 RepID=UPI00117EF881
RGLIARVDADGVLTGVTSRELSLIHASLAPSEMCIRDRRRRGRDRPVAVAAHREERGGPLRAPGASRFGAVDGRVTP